MKLWKCSFMVEQLEDAKMERQVHAGAPAGGESPQRTNNTADDTTCHITEEGRPDIGLVCLVCVCACVFVCVCVCVCVYLLTIITDMLSFMDPHKNEHLPSVENTCTESLINTHRHSC